VTWLKWLRLIGTAGTPEGCRESTRFSYDQHLRGALKGKGAGTDPPHHTALYGALGSWYKVRGISTHEVVLWGELAPFLSLPETETREAIAEYTVYMETPGEANTVWLANIINRALSPSAVNEPTRSLAVVGVMYRAAWCDLLRPDIKASLDAEVDKVRRAWASKPQDEELTK